MNKKEFAKFQSAINDVIKENDKLIELNKNLNLELLHVHMELTETNSKYEKLCSVLKKGANDERNEFLTSYNKSRDFF